MPIEAVLSTAQNALDDLKAIDMKHLDVTAFTDVTDHLLICSGRSNRHVKALANSVAEQIKAAKLDLLSMTGTERCEWVVVDLGIVVVHVMLASIREQYDLESLWTDPEAAAAAASHHAD